MKIIDDIKILTGNKKPSDQEQKVVVPKKILIVEDEKPLATLLSDRFTEEGYTVLLATNGKEGLELATAHNPKAIILDLLMPVMDGREMLRQLREIPQYKHTPVIVLTNAGEVDNIRYTVRYHDAIDFLVKSNVTVDQIVQKIKAVAW